MKSIKFCFGIIPILLISSCTQFERFNTNKVLPDALGNNTSGLKITTNVKDVFIIPSSDCISISDNVFSANNQYPKRTAEGCSLWAGCSKAPFEENKSKTVGMPSVSLEELSNKHKITLIDKTYISKEYRIEPNKSYTIFIKTLGNTINLLFKDAIDEYGFGMYFTPKENQDYQIIIQRDISNSMYTYSYKVLDITNNIVKPIEPRLVGRAYGCKK